MFVAACSTVVLIGGPAAAGKTTVARLLARRRGLRWYSTDAHSWTYRARAVAAGHHAEADPSPGTFDRGPMIAADLAALAGDVPLVGTVVEGALVTPDLAPLDRAVWLMPSAAEQRRRLIGRSRTIDAGYVLGHRFFTDRLAGTAAVVIDVDGQTVGETLVAVEAALAPALAGLPSARTARERRPVIRYGNRSLADQLRVSLDHGLLEATVGRTFDCECGRPGCTAMVDLRADEVVAMMRQPAGTIRASGHQRSAP